MRPSRSLVGEWALCPMVDHTQEALMSFNYEQLRVRAREFALTNELALGSRERPRFWPAFRSDMASLRYFAVQLTKKRAACTQPAEDWLLDHIAFVETQAQEVLRKLPRQTLHALPTLQNTGMPRIYALCEDYLDHVDGSYDVHSFEIYLHAYQEISVLKVLEDWSLPTAMRVVIIRRLAQVMEEVRERHEVCHFVTNLLGELGAKDRTDAQIRALLDRRTREQPLRTTEVVHLVQHLTEWEPDIRIVRDWLAAHVENGETSLEQMVSFEHELQAELQVTTGHLVQSLHLVERHPWRSTFTKICHVEQTLLSDKSGEYKRMDFSSRDLVRNRICDIARQLSVPETLVARSVIDMAAHGLQEAGQEKGPAAPMPRDGCPAYYVLDPDGITRLRQELTRVARPRRLPQLAIRRRPLSVYLASAVLLFLGLWLLAGFSLTRGIPLRLSGWLAVFSALALPVSEWAVFLVHTAIGWCCKPETLVRYDFSAKLPEEARTMVVIPIIWSTREEVADVVERLEVHYLANRQENIHFAVLADFKDSAVERQKDDDELVDYAIHAIQALQTRYGQERFFLFHRDRKFNAAEGVYMGWERKRGKLVEFVELLTGSDSTSFATVHGETAILPSIRYVFTVDHDTQLPIGVVGRMAGTIHFPYNRPRLNAAGTRVVEGYGVLQPRIGVSYESTQRSRFASLWAGEPGIDPYSFAVSNPYQDLFGRAMYVGKGIFDVAVFRQTLVNRIPDNQVLSHDLLEGGFLRTGLCSDIEVVEEYPNTFLAYQQRAHRWIRGDWQLIHWLGRTCRDRFGKARRTDLCGLTKWQIVDNLRRNLVWPALLVNVWLGIHVLPGRAPGWFVVVLLTIFLPSLRSLVQVDWNPHGARRLGVTFLQNLVQFLTLPFVAVNILDAVCRALYRMLVSHRKLLEWVPARHHNSKPDAKRVFAFGPAGYAVIGLVLLTAWWSTNAAVRAMAVVMALFWGASRFVVHHLNHPATGRANRWLTETAVDLKDLAAQIWAFYGTYVTAEESWLPPDNVQYQPKEVVAHRTSPTNIGLYLASVVAAHDLGLIETAEMLQRLQNTVDTVQRLEKWEGHLFNWYDTSQAQPLPPTYVSTVDSGNFISYLVVVLQALKKGHFTAMEEQRRAQTLCQQIDALIEQTNFWALYNPDDRLFCLGYDAGAKRREVVLYDLLASEARQTSLIAIALGQIPMSHWFTLARTMTIAGGQKTLLSWSGTMFEYLMPSLTMRTYRNTVWDTTYRGVIRRQQEYAKLHHVPYGISESGYYAFDHQFNYQYRAFGVPGLGFDRGMERNLVVAPYATILTLPFCGQAGIAALKQLEELGARGQYGFFEAVDFTSYRLPKGSRYEVVQSFMAHHQGMSILTLDNLLKENIMIERFHSDPRIKATDLLLQEKVPIKAAIIERPLGYNATLPEFQGQMEGATRTYTAPSGTVHVNILSNGSLTSALTKDGNGLLTWNGLAVTRWREDVVSDTSGVVVYVHDRNSEQSYSPTRFPCNNLSDQKTVFELDRVQFQGRLDGVYSELDVTISPDLDAEVRRLTLKNEGDEERTLEVTSFLELALSSQAEDTAHPAFSKLFIQTSTNGEHECLLARRRPREEQEVETWAAHAVYVDGGEAGNYEFETDRAVFIGRGHSLSEPNGLWQRLKGTVGSVADPSFSMRRTVHLRPGETVRAYVVTSVARTEQQVLSILSQLRAPEQADRAFHLAWVRTQIDLRHLHLTPQEAVAAHQLAGRLLYTSSLSRERQEAILSNTLGQSALWTRGVSGDAPILVVRVRHLADLPFVSLLARQHQYLVGLGLIVDLVVIDDTAGYLDEFTHQLRDSLLGRGVLVPKRVITMKGAQLSEPERILLQAVSRVWLEAGGPSLRAQLQLKDDPLSEGSKAPTGILRLRANPKRQVEHGGTTLVQGPGPQGEFYNGWGSFVDEGRAYQILVRGDAYLPRPWSNVLANPHFGCLVTELGTGYTWWGNAREFKLTPWSNDPVLDAVGEALYLSDRDTAEVWSGAPKPTGGQRVYSVLHGFGFTRFEQQSGAVAHTMETLVPVEDTLKVIRLSLTNQTDQPKTIAVTYYAEWVLGVSRQGQAPFIVTEWDHEGRALLAQNRYQETFRDALAFLHITVPGATVQTEVSFTADRRGFVGDGGSIELPSALSESGLSGRTGTFADPCGAVQTVVQLAPRASQAVLILLGSATSREEVHRLIEKYAPSSSYDEALSQVTRHWRGVTQQVQVQTPDRAMDILLNGWLLYQALACRIWARTAFYQAGGAFGFRDQLQDSLAFLHADPILTKQQILHSAAHQYEEGDVQHWWHEETGKGIRTRFSDDLLWLPYAVSRYIEHTGDAGILDVEVHFLRSAVLGEGELERYEDTVVSQVSGSIWDHCLRAIRQALRFGQHGLPLMGIGDWNDGMNRIGAEGRGESVWLGWFLLYILKWFARVDRYRAEPDSGSTPNGRVSEGVKVAVELEQSAHRLQQNLNQCAWDGAWFRRAFSDWGVWLGSIENKECRIDAIAQSWSVISEGSTRDRLARAMRSFDRELVDRELGVARLLTPAFDDLSPRAGYIQGYPPGIRENGGQYTHGVIWSIVAWAMLGRGDKALELFNLLNPISHTKTVHEVLTYGTEPYVMTADVYTANPHQGFGGWSWYTGAAGWMYQAGLEYVLGLQRRGNRLYIRPCVPEDWESFQVMYRYGETLYSIQVDCSLGMGELLTDWTVDGQSRPNTSWLELVDDKAEHLVSVRAPRADLTDFG